MTTPEEEIFDGYIPQDPNFNTTPVFGFTGGSLVISAPIQNEQTAHYLRRSSTDNTTTESKHEQ
jgi:hypothetical protein